MLALLIAILVGIVAAVVMHSQEAFSDKENPEMNRGIVSVITSVVAYILLAFSVGIGGTADDEVELANNADRNEAVSETEDGEKGTSQRPSEKRKEDEAEDEEDGSLLGNIFKKKDKEKAESDNEDEGIIANIFGNNKKKEDKESDSPKWVYDNTSNEDKEEDEIDDVVITPIFPGDKPGLNDDLLANNDNTNQDEEKEEEKVEEDKGETEEKPSTPEKPSKPEEKPKPEKPSKPEEKPAPEKPSKPEEKPSKPEEKPSTPEEKPSKPEEKPQKPGSTNKPPVVTVVKDLAALEGMEIDFNNFFKVVDGNDGKSKVTVEIDASEVDMNTPGSYTVYITATDRFGNITSEAHSFKVVAKPVVEEPEKPEETPEVPEETPETPGDDKPGTETPETPEKPGTEKPEETPEKPEEKPEETPGEDKPETPEKPGDGESGEDGETEIKVITSYETEVIEFEREYINDDSMYIGSEIVKQFGVKGYKTYKVTTLEQNGEVIDVKRQIAYEEAPKNEIVVRGTKKYTHDDIVDAQTGDEDVDKLINLINKYRVDSGGYRPLYINPKLQKAAEIRAKEIEENYSHTRPDGSNFSTVLNEVGVISVGGGYGGHGENIMIAKDADEAFIAWVESKDHNDNMLYPRWVEAGIARYEFASEEGEKPSYGYVAIFTTENSR